jgi:hypothetical protein
MKVQSTIRDPDQSDADPQHWPQDTGKGLPPDYVFITYDFVPLAPGDHLAVVLTQGQNPGD